MRTALSQAWNGLLGLQRWIMFLSCALIIVGLFSEVLCRYVLETSIFGLNELILIPAFWMYFMGASYSSHLGTHISANVLQVYLGSERAKAVLRLVIAIISLVLGLIFIYWGCAYILDSMAQGGTSNVFGFPLFIPQSAVLAGFVLMVMYTSVDVVGALRDVRSAGKEG